MNQTNSGIGYSAPFPHTVIDGYLSSEAVGLINSHWPRDWTKEAGKNNKKWHTRDVPNCVADVIAGVDLTMLEQVTGITGLFTDPELFGAGLHCIPPGGFLNMHCDFNYHPKGWRRRVNMLIYLNERWEDSWNGHLQLGLNGDAIKIAPIGGRAVIFETNDTTWHGHPEPLACPDDVQRRSLALYFYTADSDGDRPHTTIYKR